MWWNIRRHANRDAECPVQEQVWECRRKHFRLLASCVVVWNPRDGLLFKVSKKRFAYARHLRFGVSHGGRRVAINRTEVALTKHERIAVREGLCHLRHRVIHRDVAVRVVLTKHLADHRRAFAKLRPRQKSHILHGIEDAAMHWLQSVTYVWQCAPRDNGHGVVDV